MEAREGHCSLTRSRSRGTNSVQVFKTGIAYKRNGNVKTEKNLLLEIQESEFVRGRSAKRT